MRKSFELLDWMKGHFGTPVGEHLSYTSQGIDAKEGDTAQKGVVRLSDAITPESTHETAATPQAVKEYVDANAGSGSGGIDMSKDNVFSGTGDLRITSKRSGDAGGIRLTRESSQSAKVFLDLEKDRAVLGCGSSPTSFLEGLTVTNNMVAVKSSVNSFVYNNSPVITENTARTPIENYLKDNLTASEGIVANVVPTVGTTIKGVLADEQNLGVVKLTHTVSHGEHPNEAVTPDGVAAYVDGKLAPSVNEVNFVGSGSYASQQWFNGINVDGVVIGTLFFALDKVNQTGFTIGAMSVMPQADYSVSFPLVSSLENGARNQTALRIRENGTVELPNGAPNTASGSYYSVFVIYQAKE